MKAISIRQPWASAVVFGLKKIDNRSWPTGYRGKILIHAGKTYEGVKVLPRPYWYEHHPLYNKFTDPPCGYLIGLAEITGCFDVSDEKQVEILDNRLGQKHVDDWGVGQYCWIVENAVEFKRPILYRGQLGLFNVPDEVVKEALLDVA